MTPKTPAGLETKSETKLDLQKSLHWVEEARRPMLCMVTGVSDELGGNLLKELLPGLLELPVDIVILGKGPASYGSYLTGIASEHNHRMAIVPNSASAVKTLCEASDMTLFLSGNAPSDEVQMALSHGAIPIAPSALGLGNYNPNQESGNAFTFKEENVWHAFAAVVRALETYKFPFDWKTIQGHCMETKYQ